MEVKIREGEIFGDDRKYMLSRADTTCRLMVTPNHPVIYVLPTPSGLKQTQTTDEVRAENKQEFNNEDGTIIA
jgi:hypothetical protein